MKVTQVTLTLGYTYNLGEYKNIRPEIALTAQLHDSDDANHALFQLSEVARDHCYHMIDDALEQEEKPAHFSQEPRFVAFACQDEKVTVIVPKSLMSQFKAEHPYWTLTRWHYNSRGYRYPHLMGMLRAEEEREGYLLLDVRTDCLPSIEPVFKARVEQLIFVGRGEPRHALPDYVFEQVEYVRVFHRNFDAFLQETSREAEAETLTLITIGASQDWETLKDVIDLKRQWEVSSSSAEDDIPFEEDDGDDNDEDE